MEIFLPTALLALTIFFLTEIIRTMRVSNRSVSLINKFLTDRNKDELIDAIWEFVNADRRLKKIVTKHSATREDFSRLHDKLMIRGDFRKYNRYVPITSFFYSSALNYLLEHRDDDPKSLTEKMMNYFNF